MLNPRLLGGAALILLSACAVAQSKPDSPRAYGLNLQKGTLTLSGSAIVHGAHQRFKLTFDRSFRYRWQVDGPLRQVDGFDGRSTWTEGPAGVPHPTYSIERDAGRLSAWTLVGLWADSRAPILSTPDPTAPGSLYDVKPKDGVALARLYVDPATGLANSLSYDDSEGPQRWEFQNYQDFHGRMFPTHIVLHSGSQDDVYDVETVTPDDHERDLYIQPAPDTSLFAYDPSISPEIGVKRIAGYLFIRPKVDGQDLGWFFMDTGADMLCIDPTIAKKLSLAKVGSDTTAGAVAVTQMSLDQGHSLQIGPVTLSHPVFIEFDLLALTAAFGIPVVGVCGYDLFSRTVVDVDPKSNTIAIYPPNQLPKSKAMRWEPIKYSGNDPVIEASYAPDHRGDFHLDTGSGNTVDFFSPTVTKYRLDLDPSLKKSQTGGAGGSAASLSGRIAWFELGGVRIDNPIVGFQTAHAGAFASPYQDGNIGMGFMGRFHIIFDYTHQRVGFVRAE